MPNERDIIRIEVGATAGDIDLDALIEELEGFKDGFSLSDAELGEDRKIHYKVVDITRRNPYSLALRPVAENPTIGNPFAGAEKFISAVQQAHSTGTLPKDMSKQLKTAVRRVVKHIGNTVASVFVSTPRMQMDLTTEADLISVRNREITMSYLGTVQGLLDHIYHHGGVRWFEVWPMSGLAERIKCVYPDRLAGKVERLLTKYVEVSGEITCDRTTLVPMKLEVDDVQQIDESDDDDFGSLRGSSPNATGELSTQEYIEEQRRGWD